ncbi:hypothetical protein AB8Q18_08465 [Neisseriaceae bacterium CLB008]
MFISTSLINEIKCSIESNLFGAERLLEICIEVNDLYKNQHFGACHGSIRLLVDFTLERLGIDKFHKLGDSKYWKGELHKDLAIYQEILGNINNKLNKTSFLWEGKEDFIANDLNEVYQTRVFANNNLHKLAGMHKISLDENTLPSKQQVHLLISVCLTSMIHRSKSIESKNIHYEKFTKGLSFETFKTTDEKIDYYFHFYNVAFENKSIAKLKGILGKTESVTIALHICRGAYDEAQRYINKAIDQYLKDNKNKKDKDLNRLVQLKTCLLNVYLFKRQFKSADKLAQEMFSQFYDKYPTYVKLISNKMWLYSVNNNVGEKQVEDWAEKYKSCLGPWQLPDDIEPDYKYIFDEVWKDIHHKKNNIITYGRYGNRILGPAIQIFCKSIIDTCSYGLLDNIPKYIESMIQSTILELEVQEWSNYKDLDTFVLNMLYTYFLFQPYMKLETYKMIVSIYNNYNIDDSLPVKFINLVGDRCSIELIEFLIDNSHKLEIDHISTLKDKVKQVYLNKKFPLRHARWSSEPQFLKLFTVLTLTQKSILKNDIDFIIIEIDRLDLLPSQRIIGSIIEEMVITLTDLKRIEFYFNLRELLIDFIQKERGDKLFNAFYFYRLQGEYNDLTFCESLSLQKWYQYYAATDKVDGLTSIELVTQLEKTIDLMGTSKETREWIIDSYHRVFSRVIKHLIQQDYNDFKLVGQIMSSLLDKIFQSQPIKSDKDVDVLYGPLYGLLCSELPVDLCIIFYEKVQEILSACDENPTGNGKNGEGNIYYFYSLLIGSVVNNKKINNEELYQLLFQLETVEEYRNLAVSLFYLFKRLEKENRVILNNVMINILLDKTKSFQNQQSIATIYRKMCDIDPFSLKCFELKKHLFSPIIQKIILGT